MCSSASRLAGCHMGHLALNVWHCCKLSYQTHLQGWHRGAASRLTWSGTAALTARPLSEGPAHPILELESKKAAVVADVGTGH